VLKHSLRMYKVPDEVQFEGQLRLVSIYKTGQVETRSGSTYILQDFRLLSQNHDFQVWIYSYCLKSKLSNGI
jgi:hypothetical protein